MWIIDASTKKKKKEKEKKRRDEFNLNQDKLNFVN